MRQRTSPLDHVTVAAPCSAGWDNMVGDERVRFCGQCSLNVYNLSAMTKSDAERLVSQTEGRLCVRYYRRSDGTILTDNCPVGLRALKRRLSRIASASISATLSFFTGILAVKGLPEWFQLPAATQGSAVIKVNDKLPDNASNPGTFETPGFTKGEMIMGDIAPSPGWVDGELILGQMLVKERPARFRPKKK